MRYFESKAAREAPARGAVGRAAPGLAAGSAGRGGRGSPSAAGALGPPPAAGVNVVGLVLQRQLNTALLESLQPLDFKRFWLPESRAQQERAFPVSVTERMALPAVR